MNYPAVPKTFGTRYQQLKMPVTGCHSALDAKSRFSFFYISAFAGMTIFYTPMQSIEECFDSISTA
jgi:hypothetical protein